jgi:glucose/arabinose dehydrogenase
MGTIRRFALLLLLVPLTLSAQTGLEPMFGGKHFEQPVFMLPLPGSRNQWVVIERRGLVIGLKTDGSERHTLLDLRGRIDSGPMEAGLLGMAFHPQFVENGRLFLSYTRDGSPLVSVLAEYHSADGGRRIDPTSERVLLETKQPYRNHNGGHIAFGPEGYLYYGLGDGGSGGDPRGNGQNPNTLLGALLRLDVDGQQPYAMPAGNPFAKGGGRAEIYAWGLRNPWRWSFDRKSGALWLGDVGQDKWEEINRVDAGDNLGWNQWEGLHCYRRGCRAEGVVMPRAEYDHDKGCSVTGGYVYRGKAMPELLGHYLYGDFCSGSVWVLDIEDSRAKPRILLQSGKRISSFAEGRDGELYLLDFGSGRIFQISGE